MSIASQLTRIYQQIATQAQQASAKPPQIMVDSDWPSPCQAHSNNGQLAAWQPVAQVKASAFNDLEKALPISFSPDFIEFYASVYSHNLTVSFEGARYELLQCWSDQDLTRLAQNMTGHVLMKRRLKQDDSLFIGLTDEEDLLLTLHNQTGQVCLEYLGRAPHQVLSQSLLLFLQNADGIYIAP